MKECRTCNFFFLPEGNERVGVCRLKPPIVTASNDLMMRWPRVKDNELCGEYMEIGLR